MTAYRFVTVWEVGASAERVFDVLARSEHWPEWWRGVTRVETVARGDDAGLGDIRRYSFRSRLPYTLTFDMRSTLVEAPWRLEGEASGDLRGSGRWRLSPSAGGVTVRYDWEVETTEWWMNLLAPVARPLFAWNHDLIMRWGEEGLCRRLGLPAPPSPVHRRMRLRSPVLPVLAAALGLACWWRRRR